MPKGARTEELLRRYFLDIGYFAVRDIQFIFQGHVITDVDLWLYLRPSILTRQRTIVDIKNKRTPQAIERIFWTKGLQEALGLDGAVVATTDKRPAVRNFGLQNNVTVLDDSFLSKLESQRAHSRDRLSEEEFLSEFGADLLGKMRGDWLARLQLSKSRLLSHLDFSGCNTWLADASYFAEQTIVDPQRRVPATRLLYLSISFFLIALDFILKDFSFVDPSLKAKTLKNGFTHGAIGSEGVERLLAQSITLIENYLPEGRRWTDQLRKNVLGAFQDVPADILKEFFGRVDISGSLFVFARKLEELAYFREFTPPQSLDAELKSVVGVVLDFSQIERAKFFDVN